MAEEKSNEKNKTITADMNIMEIIQQKPEAANVLLKHGFHCLGCAAAQFETLEEGAQAHGLDNDQINQVVKEINDLDKE